MRDSDPFFDQMLPCLKSLRAFAISLSGNTDRAEDLVQETLLRAMAARESFEVGSNMSAWLFTILRNHFRSAYRKKRREVEDPDGHYAAELESRPEQWGRLQLTELQEALATLPKDQREVLSVVAIAGYSYQQATEILGCAEGTIKSRLFRAREILNKKLRLFESPRELNKKNWLEKETEANPASPPQRIWNTKVQGPQDFYNPPAESSPVRHYRGPAARKLYAVSSHRVPTRATVRETKAAVPTVLERRVPLVPIRKPDLVVESIPLFLTKTEVLPDGHVRRIYALE